MRPANTQESNLKVPVEPCSEVRSSHSSDETGETPVERRGRRELNRGQNSQDGHSAEEPETPLQRELRVNGWLRIGLRAKEEAVKFNNLLCHFTVENFRQAFQALDGNKATGVDGKTKAEYARNLDGNLTDLVNRIHKGTYRPQPKRGVLIPKANGKMRPIAISCFEDKLVEWVVAKILGIIYEPIFIKNSFGFRPKKGAHDAIKAAYCSLKDDKRPHVVEIDLRSFFDTVPHRRLFKLLRLRITDRRFKSLIARFLQAGVLEEQGTIRESDTGTAQGSIMSPILANVYLHYCLDEWFLKNYASKNAVIVRYADDAVFIFKEKNEAEEFMGSLRTKLSEYGLSLNEDKSGIILMRKNSGKVFHFLGFTFYWGKDRGAKNKRFKVKTEKTRLMKKIQEFAAWIKEVRSQLPLDEIWDRAAAKLRGHYNYYGVTTNVAKLAHYYHAVVGLLFVWLNRRSQRKSFSWERFQRRLRWKPLPMPPTATSLKPLIDRSIYAV